MAERKFRFLLLYRNNITESKVMWEVYGKVMGIL